MALFSANITKLLSLSVLFSGNIENPRIEYVIERDIGIDKDTIDTIRTVFASGKYENAQQILEDVYGEEYTRIYSIRDFQTDAWENRGAEGENSHESNQGYGEGYSSITQNQRRTETLTDRDVLSMAADQILSIDAISQDAAVSDALGILKKRLSTLDELQEKRRELGKTYREFQFGANVDREKAAETLKQMHELDAKIQEAEKKVIAAETAPALCKVLPVARRIVEQKQKDHDDEVLNRWRDRRNNAAAIKKYRERIGKDVKDLTK